MAPAVSPLTFAARLGRASGGGVRLGPAPGAARATAGSIGPGGPRAERRADLRPVVACGARASLAHAGVA